MTDSVPHTRHSTQYNVDVMLHYVMLSNGLLCFAVLHYIILCYVMLLCYVTLGQVKLRYVLFMLFCYVMLR